MSTFALKTPDRIDKNKQKSFRKDWSLSIVGSPSKIWHLHLLYARDWSERRLLLILCPRWQNVVPTHNLLGGYRDHVRSLHLVSISVAVWHSLCANRSYSMTDSTDNGNGGKTATSFGTFPSNNWNFSVSTRPVTFHFHLHQKLITAGVQVSLEKAF